jgi:hypothetical protein
MTEMRNTYNVSYRQELGKRWLGRHRHRWRDNVETELEMA